MVLGQHGGVGRTEDTETWSAEGRNEILVTRTGGEGREGPRGQEWDREVPAAGRASSWRLSRDWDQVLVALCSEKIPGFQARDRKLFALDFFVSLTSRAAQHHAQLWHMPMAPFW